MRPQKGEQLALRLLLAQHGVADVGAVEAGEEQPRLAQLQAAGDVLARLRVGGGGQRHARHAGKPRRQPGELQIFGAEIMPPLADAMRLVDGEERDLHPVQHLQEIRHHQPFGRDIEQVQPPRAQIGAHLRPLGPERLELIAAAARRVGAAPPPGRASARSAARRRCRPRAAQRRQLVTQRFAAAGRHQHDRVAAGDDMRDHRFLLPAKGGEPEQAVQHIAWVGNDVRWQGGGVWRWAIHAPGYNLRARQRNRDNRPHAARLRADRA